MTHTSEALVGNGLAADESRGFSIDENSAIPIFSWLENATKIPWPSGKDLTKNGSTLPEGKVLAFLDLSGDGGVARLVGHDGNEDNSHCEKETFGKIAFSLLRHKNTPF